MKTNSMAALRMFVCAGFIITGCAPAASTKPEASSSSASASQQGVGGAKPAQPVRQQSAGSSLDAHREGRAPVSGPLKDIYFDFDKSDLNSVARATLQAHAAWLKANPSARLEIEGHCDERGTTEYNLALGSQRARAASDYLVSLGISAQRVSTTSYGEELPVCREMNDGCYQKNRRDRFVVSGSRPGV